METKVNILETKKKDAELTKIYGNLLKPTLSNKIMISKVSFLDGTPAIERNKRAHDMYLFPEYVVAGKTMASKPKK
jgi:hypothetical protein